MAATILYPHAVSPHDRYMVCRLSDGAIVEGHSSLQRATDAASVLDAHNERTGHAERFIVRSRDRALGTEAQP